MDFGEDSDQEKERQLQNKTNQHNINNVVGFWGKREVDIIIREAILIGR